MIRVYPEILLEVFNSCLRERMDLPAGTSIIGFVDDALVVCAAKDVKILELRINDCLWRAKRWLNSRCLKISPEKCEALLVKSAFTWRKRFRAMVALMRT